MMLVTSRSGHLQRRRTVWAHSIEVRTNDWLRHKNGPWNLCEGRTADAAIEMTPDFFQGLGVGSGKACDQLSTVAAVT